MTCEATVESSCAQSQDPPLPGGTFVRSRHRDNGDPPENLPMNLKVVVATVVALGLAAAAWFYRGTAPVAGAVRAVGLPVESTTPLTAPTLKAAGVHKCVGRAGTSYIDGACPQGTREVAANGGTMTVTSFPKPAAAPASAILGGPLLKPMDPAERDRLRDKAIEDAANR
jgi:hypothetical protein